MKGTKYLSELLSYDTIKKDDKNIFIIAGCGGGKTHFAKGLMKQYNKCLYLVDTKRLKKSVEIDFQEDNISNVDVMCYKTFGHKFNRLTDMTGEDLLQYDLIIGDEVHNLYKYYKKYDHDLDLYRAIELLMSEHSTIKKVIMTATPSYIDMFLKLKSNLLDCYTTYDFTDDKDIIRYEELYKDYITNYQQIQNILQINIPKYNLENKKFLIYTPKIETMKYLENVCKELNMRPICIWSEGNKKQEMTRRQYKFADNLLETGLYYKDYNVLIINDSTETGVNIRDDVQYVIIDSTNPVTRTQVRNRVRHDVVLITLKSNGSRKERPDKIKLDKCWLDKPLTTEDKKVLCEQLGLTDKFGRVLKWRCVSDELTKKGYEIKNTTLRIEGKRTRVSIINKMNTECTQ